MKIIIELSKNKKEAIFLIKLLEKLNIPFTKDTDYFDISQEHKMILDERIKDFEENTN
jgi:hypothetical protein